MLGANYKFWSSPQQWKSQIRVRYFQSIRTGTILSISLEKLRIEIAPIEKALNAIPSRLHRTNLISNLSVEKYPDSTWSAIPGRVHRSRSSGTCTCMFGVTDTCNKFFTGIRRRIDILRIEFRRKQKDIDRLKIRCSIDLRQKGKYKNSSNCFRNYGAVSIFIKNKSI